MAEAGRYGGYGAGNRWFILGPGGPDAGEIRMRGWLMDTIPTEGGGAFRFGVCPLCRAMVPDRHETGDEIAVHEQYHAATDHPIPDELVQQRARLIADRVVPDGAS